jgi:hypothetical protein
VAIQSLTICSNSVGGHAGVGGHDHFQQAPARRPPARRFHVALEQRRRTALAFPLGMLRRQRLDAVDDEKGLKIHRLLAQSVPSLSKVAMRSGAGTKLGEPSCVTLSTNSTMARLDAVSFQEGRGRDRGRKGHRCRRAQQNRQRQSCMAVLFFMKSRLDLLSPATRGSSRPASGWADSPSRSSGTCWPPLHRHEHEGPVDHPVVVGVRVVLAFSNGSRRRLKSSGTRSWTNGSRQTPSCLRRGSPDRRLPVTVRGWRRSRRRHSHR